MKNTTLKSAIALLSCAGINLAVAASPVESKTYEANINPVKATATTTKSREFLDWLGNWTKLYKADKKDNPWIQEFNLSLRMQYQAGWTDPSGDDHTLGGSHDDGFRRFRVGANAKMFNGKLKLVNVWDVGGVISGRAASKSGSWHHVDSRAHLYEAYAAWTEKPVEIGIGKMKPGFSTEYRTSSSAIITAERSVLVNQLRSETNWGLQLKNSNKDDKMGWLLGAYLNPEGGGLRGDEIEFNSEDSAFVFASLSYDTSGFLTKKGRVWLDYTHNFTDYVGNKSYPAYGNERYYKGTGARDAVALSWDIEQGRFAMVSEILAGFDITNAPTAEASNVWGIVLMPSYKFTKNIEGVFRYQYANGTDAIKAEKRYAVTTTTSTKYADELHALYFGLNFYLDSKNPHMAKIVTGAEYSNYKNDKGVDRKYAFTGWTYYVALRTNF